MTDSGWELQATDGDRGFWTKDRTITARQALERLDQHVRTEPPQPGGLGL
jgi:hypothetical protein